MKKLFFFLTFFASIYQLEAQQSDSLMMARLQKFENFMAKLPKISGNLDLRYQFDQNQSSFDIRRARLSLAGDITKWFDYRLQVEFASSPKLLDAYIRAKIKPWFSIQVGEYKLPFSIENPYSPKDLELIDNAMGITKLCSYEDLSGIRSNGRDIGITFYGKLLEMRGFPMIEYWAGIFNGNGINIKDNNKSKDIVGRLYVRPIKNLLFSASAYFGEMVEDEDHLYERRDRYAFGLEYKDQRFTFRSEYFNGLTAGQRSEGVYALFGCTFWQSLMPVIRFDLLKEDRHVNESLKINYTAGISYFAYKYVRFQINYTYQTYFEREKNGSYVVAMVSAMF